jgi:MHS family proline/betaine transporter-like MFS transporter
MTASPPLALASQTHAPHIAAVPPNPVRVVVAAGIGTAFEVYDFTLFAFFAVVIAPAFFPASNQTTSLLLTAATFGIGAIMRPVGALVFGAYGDRVGRKTVLSTTILLMAVGSVTIGLVPRYDTIGLWAPFLIVLARMMQGFSAGGEQGGAATFIVEHVPVNRRGFYLGFHGSASLGATLVSAGFGLSLNRLLGPAVVADWGWRIPFLFGGLIAPVGFYIRSRLPESELFVEAQAKRQAAPANTVARPPLSLSTLFLVMGGFIPGTVVNYLGMIYMPTYLKSQQGVSLDLAYKGVFIASACIAVGSPIAGALSDWLGRRPLVMAGCVILLLGSYPLYMALQGNPGFGTVLSVELIFALLMTLTSAPMMPLAAEHFPTGRRSLGMSIGMTLPIAIFGTCSPLIVTWLMMRTGSPMAPALYLIAAAGAGLLALCFLPERPRSLA